EQIMGRHIDFRADIYSLGVTFYELLTSRVPFDSETNSEFQIQKAHLETPPPRPSLYNPHIGAKLEKIILQALQKKVEKRFQSAGELIGELKKIQTELGKTDLSDFSPAGHTQVLEAPTVRRRHLRKSPLKPIALLILLLAAAIAWILISGKFGRHDDAEKPQPLQNETQRPGPTPAAADAAGTGTALLQEPDHGAAGLEENKAVQDAAGTAAVPKQETLPVPTPAQEKTLPPQTAPLVQEQPLAAEPLGSLDAELIRLRGFLARRNLLAADRLADALLRNNSESRILPLLGNVKFFLGKFAAAESLWARSLQANQMVSLELRHVHDAGGDFCSGQLKFKKKVILFNSDARGDHSLALQAANIQSLRLGNDLRITVTAVLNGQEIKESFMLDKQFGIEEKEKFLVDFLNQYVL
ncbi:MAG TPA: hypothetical protein VLQ89_04725, partial [Candidatus Binatia bacterium]|nr:hypothetical protein [Candidatus Binatia bacterium]